MKKISVNSVCRYGTTVVPNAFIDRYMPTANGAYVKVFLYLLRHLSESDTSFSLNAAAEQLDESENDIKRALNYWEKQRVLSLERDDTKTLTGITLLNLETAGTSSGSFTASVSPAACFDFSVTASSAAASDTPAGSKAASVTVLQSSPDNAPAQSVKIPELVSYPLIELTEEEEKDIKWLTKIVEGFLGDTLKPSGLEVLMYLYRELHFSNDLIVHLYDYCIRREKRNREYILTVARSWYQNGIDTPEKAIAFSVEFDSCFNIVNHAFGLNRAPGVNEREYIRRWNASGLPLVLIEEACNRTLANLCKPNFQYADKIISSWIDAGVKTPEEVRALDETHVKSDTYAKITKLPSAKNATILKNANNRFNAYTQREYSEDDFVTIERKLLKQ